MVVVCPGRHRYIRERMVTSADLLRWHWRSNFTRSDDREPLVPPLFVAELGSTVQLVDIRSEDQATGLLGYIPGSSFLDIVELRDRVSKGEVTIPLVVVSGSGRSAARLAQELETQGAERVAAMAGGIAGWRAQGLATSRDPAGVRKTLFGGKRLASAGPMTLERIQQHIGDPRVVRWIKMSSMISGERLSCIDGREERGVIGTPGGTAGEFLLAMAAIESVTGRNFDKPSVRAALLHRLDLFGRFCLHTDVDAFTRLIDDLDDDPRFEKLAATCKSTESWFEALRRPDRDQRDALLEMLVESEHVGCGHVRLMLERGREYGIRQELVRTFVRSFFELWWEGSPETVLTLLPGQHEEKAVVNVRQEDGVWDLSRIPLISPAVGQQQVFVHHPDVARYLRRNAVRSAIRGRSSLGVDPALEQDLQNALDDLAARQLGLTVGYLAKDLPVFDVVFGPDGNYEVRES